jgi:uncharacterized protein YjbI with pentapeptide repeats
MAELNRTPLSEDNLSQADLGEATLSGANLENALSLKKADLRGTRGLTNTQLTTYKAKGAILDEEPMASSSQSTVTTPLSSQDDDAQAPSSQGNATTSDPVPKTT